MLAKVIWCCLIFLVTILNGLVLKDTPKFFGHEKTSSEIYEICTGATTTNDSTGTLQTPGFPSDYTRNVNCYFYINAPYGSNIQINLNYLSTSYSDLYSYLQISNSSMSVAKLTGRFGSVDYTYNVGNNAIIHFYIYARNGYSGAFRLTWKSIKVSECQGPDILFLLDRSQAIFSAFYNTNIKNFLRNFTEDYLFTDDTNYQNFFSSRFGIIEFSDNATLTVPLKQYSRTEFLNKINNNVSYGDGGDSNVTAALSLAFNEFTVDGTPDENGYHVPRLFILVVNDISQFGYKNTLAAMDKLKKLYNFQREHGLILRYVKPKNEPVGIIIPGIPGAQDRLADLIGYANYTFGSLDTATATIPSLTNNLKCPFCSNLIFICEMTVAIGYNQKIQCLKLAQKLASATADNEKKRYAIGTYGKTIYNNIQLQTFSDFNETINNMIDSVTTDNQPNGGQTYLAPILNQLYNTLHSNYTTAKSASFILIMGELSSFSLYAALITCFFHSKMAFSLLPISFNFS